MNEGITEYKVHQCSMCLGDTEYFCATCKCDLCSQCRDTHEFKTTDHDVVKYCKKYNCIPSQEMCLRHPNRVYKKYCEPCQVPLCDFCSDHESQRFPFSLYWRSNHTNKSLEKTSLAKRHQHLRTVTKIRSEALLYRPTLLVGIKSDIDACHLEFSYFQSKPLAKAQKLKEFIDDVVCDFDFKHGCVKQKMQKTTQLARIQRYEYIWEQLASQPVKFLRLMKKTSFPDKQGCCYVTLRSHLTMSEDLHKKDLIVMLNDIQTKERSIHRIEYKHALELLDVPEFNQSLTVAGVDRSDHISCVTSDRVWVSDYDNNLTLTNKKGSTLCHLRDLRKHYKGLHTINSEHDLFYIDKEYNIKKFSSDMKTTTTFIKKRIFNWKPQCLYWSPSTGDLLVGIYMKHAETGKVFRYDQRGFLYNVIQHNNGMELYRNPGFITENNNGDVVVSDSSAIVVTDRGGRHRFSFKGHQSGSYITPGGICTDALSQILFCERSTNSVQMVDKDGKFMRYLLIRPSGIFEPYSLSYDVNAHRLWVGTLYNNKICVYTYVTRQEDMTDQNRKKPPSIKNRGTEKTQKGKKLMLKLMPDPKLYRQFAVKEIFQCRHISCVTSEEILVSDQYHNLILSNMAGKVLHKYETTRLDTCGSGIHTVNNKKELLFINENLNIYKASEHFQKSSKFRGTYSMWTAACLYCSPTTGDLLVGMDRIDERKSQVARYNQSGKQTQTIQNDSNGLELYRMPCFLTENNNGDVVVSDCGLPGAVVVTDRDGRHRFSYTGLTSKLWPRGICTDALSHILVCDSFTHSVVMISEDGQLLSQLPMKLHGLHDPFGLAYDRKTHRLFVGSVVNNKICVFEYLTK